MIKYSTQHVFVRTEKNEKYAYIGISDLYNEQLDAVEFVNLPKIGEVFSEDDLFSIDTITNSFHFTSPVSGEIVEVNTELENDPKSFNDSREFSDWICKIKLFEKEEIDDLMSFDAYREYLEDTEDQDNYEEDIDD